MLVLTRRQKEAIVFDLAGLAGYVAAQLAQGRTLGDVQQELGVATMIVARKGCQNVVSINATRALKVYRSETWQRMQQELLDRAMAS